MPTVHPAHVSGKLCPKCDTFKPAESFGFRDKSGRLKSWCNACITAASLARYYADHDRKREVQRIRAAERYHRDPNAARKKIAAWRASNPEKNRAIKRRSESARKPQKAAYRKANAERIKARNAQYRQREAERIKATSATYNRKNREAIKARVRKCVAAKPDLYQQLHKAAKHRRKVRLTNNGPVEKFNDLEIFERDNWVCSLCGGKVNPDLKHPDPFSASLDHTLPIAKGGGHTKSNVALAHLRCNLAKRDRGA